jgi:hypothetical protein
VDKITNSFRAGDRFDPANCPDDLERLPDVHPSRLARAPGLQTLSRRFRTASPES